MPTVKALPGAVYVREGPKLRTVAYAWRAPDGWHLRHLRARLHVGPRTRDQMRQLLTEWTGAVIP